MPRCPPRHGPLIAGGTGVGVGVGETYHAPSTGAMQVHVMSRVMQAYVMSRVMQAYVM